MNRALRMKQVPAPPCRVAAERLGETSGKRYRYQRWSESFCESNSTVQYPVPPGCRGPEGWSSLLTGCKQSNWLAGSRSQLDMEIGAFEF